ncbi:MAG: UbiA family prenyltransferase [Candidatus Bathyarchaeota archaeon]|nr:UbiA family prenyltransferase [Candidatus Bathyarchaeota archaeon]
MVWKKTATLLTSTSLLLAIDGPLIVFFGYLLYGIPINPKIIIASFLAVFSVYNLNKATDKAEDAINRPEMATKSTAYYVIPSLVTMSVSFMIAVSVSVFALLILMTPIIVGFLYSVKISSKLPRLKEIVGAKSVFVAFTWSLSGTFLPLTTGWVSAPRIELVFSYIFIQVIVNTILFDSLDTKGDAASGMKTLPIILGKRRTKLFLIATNSILCVWLVFCGIEGVFISYLPALGFGVFYSYVLIWHFMRGNCPRLLAEVLVDGQWFPIVILMNMRHF